jgi:hypothetical protein
VKDAADFSPLAATLERFLKSWTPRLSGRQPRPNQIVRILLAIMGNPKKAELVKRIRAEVFCSSSAACEAVEKAERKKFIHYSKALKTYDLSA